MSDPQRITSRERVAPLDRRTTLQGTERVGANDSRRIAEDVGRQVADHRDVIGRLRDTAGVDAAALDEYRTSVDHLAWLTEMARSETIGELGSTISADERRMITDAIGAVRQSATQDFRVALQGESDDTVTRIPRDSAGTTDAAATRSGGSESSGAADATDSDATDAADAADAADATASDATGAADASDPYRTSGGRSYRDGPTIESLQAGERALREGDRGPAVTELQNRLQTAGYDLGTHGADGFFGPDTQRAVDAYERDRGMPEGTTRRAGISGEDFQALSTHRAGTDSGAGGGAAGAPDASNREERLGSSDLGDVTQELQDAFAANDTDRVNQLMGRMTREELAEVRGQVGNERFEEMIAAAPRVTRDGTVDGDYRGALRASTFGDRRALPAGEVEAFAQRLRDADTAPNFVARGLRAVGIGGLGTDEAEMNRLFDLDEASLRRVDAELRKTNPGGLRELIAANYGRADGSRTTRDLFNQRLDAAGL